jgi:leucyl-tRNA synthetase
VVSTEEPFPRLEFLGFILAEDGRKMSKRWKNVVNPDDMVIRFGADAFRLYEMFIGPFENTVSWSTDGVVGTRRFIERVWSTFDNIKLSSDKKNNKILHKTIKKISEDIENFKFNTAVSSLMIFMNEVGREGLSKKDFKVFLQILSPFAPHMTEELWSLLGEKKSIHLSSWPEYDKNLIEDFELKIAVQINGKVRGEIMIGVDDSEEDIKKMAISNESVAKYITGSEVKKIIYVKNKIINIVV